MVGGNDVIIIKTSRTAVLLARIARFFSVGLGEGK